MTSTNAFTKFITDYRIARTNRFVASIFGPPSLSQYQYSVIEIEAAEIPSLSISTTDFKYDQSPNVLIPYQRTPQGQVTLTVRLDENHKFRDSLNRWMELIINVPNPISTLFGYSKNYYNEITGTVTIYQLNLQGKVTSYVNLLNAYPINIDSIRYDWGENDNFARMNVTFAYIEALNKYENPSYSTP